MEIEVDVEKMAEHWGLDPRLIQAIVQAEGGGDRIIKAVQCSIPTVTTRAKALEVTCRSVTHALSDYIKASASNTHANPVDFIFFFGSRWAPVGAKNDQNGLNANWAPNVMRLWLGDTGRDMVKNA